MLVISRKKEKIIWKIKLGYQGHVPARNHKLGGQGTQESLTF